MFASCFRRDPLKLVTSYFVSPTVVAVVRFIFSAYLFIAFICNIYRYATVTVYDYGDRSYLKAGYYFFYFFTEWCFLGLIVYFWAVSFHSLFYIIKLSHHSDHNVESPLPQPDTLPAQSPLTVLLYLLYDTVICHEIVVPVIFWSLVYTPSTTGNTSTDSFLQWISVSKHGVGAFMVLVEMCVLNKLTLRKIDFLPPFITMLLYMLWTFVVHAFTGGYWPYAVMAWERGPIVAVLYIGVFIFYFVVFGLVWLLHWLKHRLARRLLLDEESTKPEQDNFIA